MRDFNFMQEDEKFLELLKSRENNAGKESILPLLEKVLYDNGIHLKSSFFLESYLSNTENCAFLNVYFLELFNKAVYLNEKLSMLKDLLLNHYDKDNLCNIIFCELKKDYSNYSDTEVDDYKWNLCEILYNIGLKKYEDKYIEFLMDLSLRDSREMLVQLLKKIKTKERDRVFKKLKESDPYFKNYKFF